MELRAYKDSNGLWRIDRVPIISTGIEYPLASGPATFTEEQIADAVAAYNDPAIREPRIKLGHKSGYNAALIGDAEQAFGRVENLVLGNFGQTAYGDYVGMPEWLGTVLPVAYPSRSIEGDWDVKTNTGREYRMIISAVSLLGVRWPGCSVLEDLPLYYGSDIPPGVEYDIQLGGIAAAATDGGGMKPGDRIKAAVDIDMIERAFYTEVAMGEDYWWWIRGERYDDTSGLQLIVDCDDGTLVRVPVSVSGSDVTFGEPVEVTEEYPDKIAAASFVAGMASIERAQGADVLVYASRADTTKDRPAVRATNEGGTMDDATRRALATRVGLDPEKATEDEINAKIDELRTATPAGGNTVANGQEGTGKADGLDTEHGALDPSKTVGTENEIVEGAPVAGGPVIVPPVKDPELEAGYVKLDADTYQRLRAGAEAGLRSEQREIAAARSSILDNAIKAGKFSPARRPHYEALLASDFEGGRKVIEELFPGMIPMEERGNAGNGSGDGGSLAGAGGGDGLPDEWFGDSLVKIRAGQIPGRTGNGRIMQAKEA